MSDGDLNVPLRFTVSHELDTFRCSTKIKTFAARLGFSPEAQWQIAIALCELVSNAARYAGGGRVTVRAVSEGGSGIEIRVEDSGPGLRAQPSPAPARPGLGAGLAAVSRLMDEVHVDSETGKGTVVVARKWRIRCGQEPLSQAPRG